MTTRKTVYVGESLGERMAAIGDTVNWSRVAAEAFEKKLAEIAMERKGRTMEDVVQRLRASKLESESQEERRARAAGQEWAKHHAEWPELERVAEMVSDGGWGWGIPNHSWSELSLSNINPDLDEEDAREKYPRFWKENAGTENPSDEFVFAFFEGAAEIYDQVQGEVR